MEKTYSAVLTHRATTSSEPCQNEKLYQDLCMIGGMPPWSEGGRYPDHMTMLWGTATGQGRDILKGHTAKFRAVRYVGYKI